MKVAAQEICGNCAPFEVPTTCFYVGFFGRAGVLAILALSKCLRSSLKKILEREDQYLYVARRTFTNLFLGVTSLNLLPAVPDLNQLSLESKAGHKDVNSLTVTVDS